MRERPDVPLMPAIFEVKAEVPDNGFWRIAFHFTEAEYDNKFSFSPWMRTDMAPRVHEFSVECSAVLDPIPSLHTFLHSMLENRCGFWSLRLDEENLQITTLECWFAGFDTLQVRVQTDTCTHDFLVPKFYFSTELYKAYLSFFRAGGWWKDFDLYSPWVEEADFKPVIDRA